MPWYVFKCARCGYLKDVMLPADDRDARAVYCNHPKCKPVIAGGKCRMERQPTAANFTVAGFAAKNGYAK